MVENGEKRDEELEGEVVLRPQDPGHHLRELLHPNPSVSFLRDDESHTI